MVDPRKIYAAALGLEFNRNLTLKLHKMLWYVRACTCIYMFGICTSVVYRLLDFSLACMPRQVLKAFTI